MTFRNDKRFVTLLRQSDEDAFITLVTAHDAALRRTARVFVSTHGAAEQVVQDTWMAVLDGARTVPVSAIVEHCHGDSTVVEPDRIDERNIPNQRLLRKQLAAALAGAG